MSGMLPIYVCRCVTLHVACKCPNRLHRALVPDRLIGSQEENIPPCIGPSSTNAYHVGMYDLGFN